MRGVGELGGGLFGGGEGEAGGGCGLGVGFADAGVESKACFQALWREAEPDLVGGEEELVWVAEGALGGDAFCPGEGAVAGKDGLRGCGGVEMV